MSADEAETDMYCAACGIAGVDDIKLKTCAACKLVRYCGVECQRRHRSQHKQACRKRVAELREELLFQQPKSFHRGDCPICFLPLSIYIGKSVSQSCCCKMICQGCFMANYLREEEEMLGHTCPFCRQPEPTSEGKVDENLKKRADANDPVAIQELGKRCLHDGDYSSALRYLTQAVELGSVDAHYQLSVMYREQKGVEMDMKKFIYHLEEAAICGHVFARHNLGCYEYKGKGNIERAAKHFIIAASLGFDASMEALKTVYARGAVGKEDFEAALRSHQAAVNATKSPQREEAEEAERNKEGVYSRARFA